MGRCIIIAASEFYHEDITITPDDYVIAVDKGFLYLSKLGITANAVVGDFDSLSFVPEHENLHEYNSDKDDTDTLIAVKLGVAKGYTQFYLYYGMGGRFDHTLANLQTLSYIQSLGAAYRGYLIDKDSVTTVIEDGTIHFSDNEQGFISVFSVDQTAVVSIIGLKYELNHHTLSNRFPLGVSNEFMQKTATITSHSGAALVTWQRINRLSH